MVNKIPKHISFLSNYKSILIMLIDGYFHLWMCQHNLDLAVMKYTGKCICLLIHHLNHVGRPKLSFVKIPSLSSDWTEQNATKHICFLCNYSTILILLDDGYSPIQTYQQNWIYLKINAREHICRLFHHLNCSFIKFLDNPYFMGCFMLMLHHLSYNNSSIPSWSIVLQVLHLGVKVHFLPRSFYC